MSSTVSQIPLVGKPLGALTDSIGGGMGLNSAYTEDQRITDLANQLNSPGQAQSIADAMNRQYANTATQNTINTISAQRGVTPQQAAFMAKGIGTNNSMNAALNAANSGGQLSLQEYLQKKNLLASLLSGQQALKTGAKIDQYNKMKDTQEGAGATKMMSSITGGKGGDAAGAAAMA